MTHFIIHYHLRNSGVTNVIRAEKKSLPHCILISSEHAEINLPWLDYPSLPELSAEELLNSFLHSVKNYPAPHYFHIHNPTLGCHPQFTEMVLLLAKRGEKLLLHIHDFAEDDRPHNLEKIIHLAPLYPCAKNVHYAVLTERDAFFLQEKNIPLQQIHILPNPCVCKSPRVSELPQGKKNILIPIRAIPRKNLAEILLFAAISRQEINFSITQAPTNPAHFSHYEEIQSLSESLKLPVKFAVSEEQNFSTLMAQATHLLSTSKQEGFGMIFLDAIAHQKPLIARDISHVSAELKKYGIVHPHRYQKITCPSITADEDFSSLDFSQQEKLIRHARKNPQDFFLTQNEKVDLLKDWWQKTLASPEILSEALLASFSLENHAKKIQEIIFSLAQSAEPRM